MGKQSPLDRPPGVPSDGFAGFAEGVRVCHPRLGIGTVLAVGEERGGDRVAVIRSDTGVTHRVLLSLAKMRLVRRGEYGTSVGGAS